jgi:formimidoylglutamate deiminase
VLLLPGFVNAHSHAFQRAFRGHVQWRPKGRDDFWSWREAMYSVANELPPEGIEAMSRLAFLEMAEAGVTQVGEFHYLHHNPDGSKYDDPNELARRVIAAALDVGIRICLLRVAYGRAGHNRASVPAQRRFIDLSPTAALEAIEALSQLADERVSVGLAPHSIRAVPKSWLQEFAQFSGPIHMHVSEQPSENGAAMAEYGCSPLAVIQKQGMLSPLFTAVHMTHPLSGDLSRLKEGGARICVCPTTELDLGDGLLPNVYREAIPLCVGSDSQARIDMMAEARALELHARALAGQRNVLTPVNEAHGLAKRLLKAVGSEGAAALGADQAGVLAVGAKADLVGLSLDRPAALGVPPLEAAVFSSNPDWVKDVWVGGTRVVRDGEHPHRASILRAARQWLRH